MITNKSSEKMRNKYNHKVVELLSQKYSFTRTYIRQCLKGDRNNLTADRIKSEYLQLCREFKEWEQVHLNN